MCIFYGGGSRLRVWLRAFMPTTALAGGNVVFGIVFLSSRPSHSHQYLKNTQKEFFDIWRKGPVGVKDELKCRRSGATLYLDFHRAFIWTHLVQQPHRLPNYPLIHIYPFFFLLILRQMRLLPFLYLLVTLQSRAPWRLSHA